MKQSYFIGWDVGAWHCKKSSKSQDAIVILDAQKKIIGCKRGNLRECLNKASFSDDFLSELFSFCKCSKEFPSQEPFFATMAIDAPLGFSKEFVALVKELKYIEVGEDSPLNKYLYRYTERYLFLEKRIRPLSAVKDMIGSQSTKAIHLLSKFAPHIESCGVWTNRKNLRIIETYPAACKNSEIIKDELDELEKLENTDQKDALTCALVAYLYEKKRNLLFLLPPQEVDPKEGWIWVPEDIDKNPRSK